MNPHTGELAMLGEGEERAGFERLPACLSQMAREKMRRFALMASGTADAEAAAPMVNLRSRSPLALWAKKKRKAKIAAASRRRNRR